MPNGDPASEAIDLSGRTLDLYRPHPTTTVFLDLRLSDNHDAESHAKSGARWIVPRVLTTRPEPRRADRAARSIAPDVRRSNFRLMVHRPATGRWDPRRESPAPGTSRPSRPRQEPRRRVLRVCQYRRPHRGERALVVDALAAFGTPSTLMVQHLARGTPTPHLFASGDVGMIIPTLLACYPEIGSPAP